MIPLMHHHSTLLLPVFFSMSYIDLAFHFLFLHSKDTMVSRLDSLSVIPKRNRIISFFFGFYLSANPGPWTPTPTTFNNAYFTLLMNLKWVPKEWDGPYQYVDAGSGKLMMLPTCV